MCLFSSIIPLLSYLFALLASSHTWQFHILTLCAWSGGGGRRPGPRHRTLGPRSSPRWWRLSRRASRPRGRWPWSSRHGDWRTPGSCYHYIVQYCQTLCQMETLTWARPSPRLSPAPCSRASSPHSRQAGPSRGNSDSDPGMGQIVSCVIKCVMSRITLSLALFLVLRM